MIVLVCPNNNNIVLFLATFTFTVAFAFVVIGVFDSTTLLVKADDVGGERLGNCRGITIRMVPIERYIIHRTQHVQYH